MGVIKRGVLGGFSGKVANIIGGSWKGIAYMRSMPLSVANPRTAGQVAQRGKMSVLVAIAKILLVSTIKPLNDRFAAGMSGYNLFVKRNVDNATTVVNVFENVILSEGNLLGSIVQSWVWTPTNVVVSMDDNTGEGNALGTDRIYGVLLNERTGEVVANIGAPIRSIGDVTFEVADGFANGDDVLMAFSYLSADGTRVSSTYRASGAVSGI
jgi:hypothetical protein